MSVAIIYYSKHGATERYARTLSEAVNGTLFDAKTTKLKHIENFDVIVYGGGVYAGGIKGIEFVQKNWDKIGKKILIFAVGLTVDDPNNQEQCRNVAFDSYFNRRLRPEIMNVPMYFLPGAYDPESIRGVDRQIIKVARKMFESKGGQEQILKYIDEGCDMVDFKKLQPLIDEIKKRAGECDANL